MTKKEKDQTAAEYQKRCQYVADVFKKHKKGFDKHWQDIYYSALKLDLQYLDKLYFEAKDLEGFKPMVNIQEGHEDYGKVVFKPKQKVTKTNTVKKKGATRGKKKKTKA